MTLEEFLAARLDEDEGAAKALRSEDWGDHPWATERCAKRGCACIVYQGEYKPFSQPQVPPIQYVADAEHKDFADHIARHDPARVLREVEAKRAILRIHKPEVFRRYGGDETCCAVCVTDHEAYMDDDNPDPWPCTTARALAAIWSGHPDYDPEWKP